MTDVSLFLLYRKLKGLVRADSDEGRPTIWTCYKQILNYCLLFISLEIDLFHGYKDGDMTELSFGLATFEIKI